MPQKIKVPKNFKSIGLSLTGLMLFALVIVPISWFLPEASLAGAGDGSAALSLADEPTMGTDNLTSNILMRRERAPWTAPITIKQAPIKQDPFAGVRITGLLMLPGKPPIAWVAEAGQEAVKLQLGSDFKGWTVDSILATSIEFSKDSEHKILEQVNDQ